MTKQGKVTIILKDTDIARLKTLSALQGKSIGTIVRSALDAYVPKLDAPTQKAVQAVADAKSSQKKK